MNRFLLIAALATLGSAASAQTYSGTLGPGDDTLDTGEYLDEYAVSAREGQAVTAVVTSEAFDTYVLVISSSGEQQDNDDCTQGDLSRSCATLVADRTGRVRIGVTSFEPGETGDYTVQITVGEGGLSSTAPAEGPGSLTAGDDQLESGEFVDRREVVLEAGQRLAATLTSSDFDPYLIVIPPEGDQQDNDDCTQGDFTRSCLDVTAETAGTYRILITSFEPGESGRYQLALDVGDGSSAPSASGGPGRTETGELASGDPTLDSGEYVDTYTVTGTGGPLVADLRSDSFDPYLIVLGPDGADVQNDDYEGSLERSLVVVDTEEGASYRVLVTSYAAEETGRYRLDIRTDDAAIVAGIRTETGTLADGDETLDSGEFIDRYTFEAVPGQRLQADLTSDAFDTYLALQTPSGEVTEDDDGGGRPGHSVLNVDLTEPGRYTVFVTSYAAAETGDYELSLDLTGEYGVEPTPGGGLADDGVPESTGRLAFEETARASLSAGDRRLSSGEFMDVHTFDISDPGPVRVEMASSAFDTFLIIESPNGQRLQNDDFEGSTSQSVVEFSANQPGRYRVIATSYREGEVGPYTMRLTAADALAPEPPAYDRIAGLFVGISDYETIGDLRWTAEDAEIAHDAMIQAGMDPSDGILLTDADATAGAVRDAIADLASRTDDRTLMVLFFSGHGGQYERAEGFQRQDPDGIDESLEMYDAPILDDEMDALLATIPSARQLVVVDACFSGGFAKDLISRPGRMGLFSSEEDIVSAVAVKFEAGGYLSRFFAEAVTQQAADEDNNGAVTALELSHYLEQRFVADVQQAEEGALDMLASRDTRPEHQKLVVDRGSVGLYESLFLFRP